MILFTTKSLGLPKFQSHVWNFSSWHSCKRDHCDHWLINHAIGSGKTDGVLWLVCPPKWSRGWLHQRVSHRMGGCWPWKAVKSSCKIYNGTQRMSTGNMFVYTQLIPIMPIMVSMCIHDLYILSFLDRNQQMTLRFPSRWSIYLLGLFVQSGNPNFDGWVHIWTSTNSK